MSMRDVDNGKETMGIVEESLDKGIDLHGLRMDNEICTDW